MVKKNLFFFSFPKENHTTLELKTKYHKIRTSNPYDVELLLCLHMTLNFELNVINRQRVSEYKEKKELFSIFIKDKKIFRNNITCY